jgi:glycosyltransferase involved in cell wall biosynthesis
MKIAIIGPTYPFRGGISQYTTLLAEQLRQSREVLFVSFRNQYPRFLFPGRTQLDESLQPILTDNERLLSFADPLSWRRSARRIVDFGPDALIISWVNPILALQFRYVSGQVRRKLPQTRVVFWCHNVALHEKVPFAKTLTRIALRHGDHFIVSYQEARADLLRLLPGSDVSVAHLPQLPVFDSGDTREEARRALGVPQDAQVVLHFGFVRPYKGLVHLIRALPRAARQVPGLRLLVVGEFWGGSQGYRDEVEQLGVQDLVTIVDRYVPNEEVGRYFEAADIVVLPYETASGSGIVQIAYSFGKPVVTTSVGALAEVVDEGKTGYLVPPCEPEALADAITGFFQAGALEDFARNIERFAERFSWDSFVDMLEGLLQR